MLRWIFLDENDVFNKTIYKGWTIYTNKLGTEVWGPYSTIDGWWKRFGSIEEALEYIDNQEEPIEHTR